jgi:acyl-CoA synthetase (AMP-forming)/AMP-acid ligase II
MNLFTLLDSTARRFPEHGAVYSGTECVLRYRELRDRAAALAVRLQELWPPGARIAIASENCPEYIELLFGIWAAGAVTVPLNAKLHAKEMADIIADSGAACVFASPRLSAALPHALTAHTGRCPVITIASPAYTAMLALSQQPLIDTTPETLAWLFYTSGTTGRSKGAMLSHRNLMAMTLAHLADIESIENGHSQIHAAPMSHGSGLYIPAYISRGARQVVPATGGFDAAEFLALCSVHPGCGAFLAPTMVQRLRLQAEKTGMRASSLRSIVYGGGPMYLEELKRSMHVFGHVFAQIYGQGESPMTITALRQQDHLSEDDSVLGSVGWPRMGCEVAVVDGQWHQVPAGETGEIVCRGDTVMAGYWNNSAATLDTLNGGWLRTGDMGSMDKRGFLTLLDRSKDVVISGGSNIYPREIEEVLLKHPAVSEVCVVGKRDEAWGEIVVAFIVPTNHVDAPTRADLDALCNDHVARFKRPKEYRFIDTLPKNSYGKVLKRTLREGMESTG